MLVLSDQRGDGAHKTSSIAIASIQYDESGKKQEWDRSANIW